MDIAAWLRGLGLEQYESAFRANEIDERVLASLTSEDLREIGVVPIGHRRLLDAIAALSDDIRAAEATPAVAAASAATVEAEAEQPKPADDPDPEYVLVVEGEPTPFDEADEIEAMSDADFLAMLERQKADFVPPNTQLYARLWLETGNLPASCHFVIAERLAPWIAAVAAAGPEMRDALLAVVPPISIRDPEPTRHRTMPSIGKTYSTERDPASEADVSEPDEAAPDAEGIGVRADC